MSDDSLHLSEGYVSDMSDEDADGGVYLGEAADSTMSDFGSDDEDHQVELYETGIQLMEPGPAGQGTHLDGEFYFDHPASAAGSNDNLSMNMLLPTFDQHHAPPPGATLLLNELLQTQGDLLATLSLDDPSNDLAPVQLSNPNPSLLGSGNLDLSGFLNMWAYSALDSPDLDVPRPYLDRVLLHCQHKPRVVQCSDLGGDRCDFQGLDWASMGTTRAAARTRRRRQHQNHTNLHGSDSFRRGLGDERIPSRESYFRFKKMTIRQDVKLAHFQLRSVLACPSRSSAFYPGPRGVNRIDLASKRTELAMKTMEYPGLNSPITTLDANHGVLLCGSFSGEYYLQSLTAQGNTNFVEGKITSNTNGITNHVVIHTPRRSASPVAAIASNDLGFRVMDVATQTFIMEREYSCPLNCSAISPDRRLRVMVGDHRSVFICCADSGEILRALDGPRDYGFACDWSDDGWTIATAAQDRCIRIWDARRLCNSSGESTPVCSLRTEMGAARSLKFSPLGSGRPVLVAVEEVDYINIIDAHDFASKQTIDVFGEMGAATFTNEGQNLNILCGDNTRGGLLEFERYERNFGDSGDNSRSTKENALFEWTQDENGTARSPRKDRTHHRRFRQPRTWAEPPLF